MACNSLVNAAPVVDKNHHAEAPPVMTGGTIADGTYFLTAMDKYNGETGTSHAPGDLGLLRQHHPGRAAGRHPLLAQLRGREQRLTYTITCPAAQAGMTGMSPYTATATQIVTVNSDDANELHTFTKQ